MIYGLLPEVFNKLRDKEQSVALVVSPLIALMDDQVASFTAKGTAAVHYCETIGKEAKAALRQGKYKLISISPETLFTSLKLRRNAC